MALNYLRDTGISDPAPYTRRKRQQQHQARTRPYYGHEVEKQDSMGDWAFVPAVDEDCGRILSISLTVDIDLQRS